MAPLIINLIGGAFSLSVNTNGQVLVKYGITVHGAHGQCMAFSLDIRGVDIPPVLDPKAAEACVKIIFLHLSLLSPCSVFSGAFF